MLDIEFFPIQTIEYVITLPSVFFPVRSQLLIYYELIVCGESFFSKGFHNFIFGF